MKNIFGKIIGAVTGEAGAQIGDIVEKFIPSDDKKSEAKKELTEVVLAAINKSLELQADVLKTEMTGNWLQKSWRPITMLTFTAIIVFGAFREIPYLESTSPFWQLLELGLGGYVVGRSVEKVAETVTQKIDLPFLKKKDRGNS